jgi:anaerobic ribonucleoside-triphosphate reductase activating protein
MYYGNIKPFSIENGTGVRVSLFVSGCRNCCKNCFSQQTWDFQYGEPFTEEVEDRIVEMLQRPYVEGLTVLGGEPMEPENQETLLPFLQKVRQNCPDKNVWIYTGFRLEKQEKSREKMQDQTACPFILHDYEKTGPLAFRANTEYLPQILALTDILVDGRFEEDKKNLILSFRGSENQRILNMKETLATGEFVLSEYNQNGRGTKPQ